MFKALFGSDKKGKILLYLYANGETHASEIAKVFKFYLNAVQYQLLNMERDGILYSKLKGKVRLFGIDPRYPFKKELEALLDKALDFVPEEEKKTLYRRRLRPRRTAKPL